MKLQELLSYLDIIVQTIAHCCFLDVAETRGSTFAQELFNIQSLTQSRNIFHRNLILLLASVGDAFVSHV